MPLEPDILAKLHEDFQPEYVRTATDLLESTGRSGRIARCIVQCASGSVDKLRHYIDLAEQDDRDVIAAAECNGIEKRVRDLSSSFFVDAPEKMWISEVAWALHRRGYFLKSIETVPAASAGAQFLSALGEGVAIFDGDLGPITVSKRLGRWRLEGEPGEFDNFDVEKPFTNVGQFSDAVSSYILAKQHPHRRPS